MGLAFYMILNGNFDSDVAYNHINLVANEGHSKCIFILLNDNDEARLYDLINRLDTNILTIDIVTENLNIDTTKFSTVKLLSRDLRPSHIQYLNKADNIRIKCQVNDSVIDTVIENFNKLNDDQKKKVELYPYTILPHTSFFRPEIENPTNKQKIYDIIDKNNNTVMDTKIPAKNVIVINYETDQTFNVINYTNILPINDANILSIINDFKVLQS